MSSNNLFSVFRDETIIATRLSYDQALNYCRHSDDDIEQLSIRSGALINKEFTDDQEKLIELLIEAGFGYAKFAESVKKQGKRSARQEEVMRNMLGKLRANAR